MTHVKTDNVEREYSVYRSEGLLVRHVATYADKSSAELVLSQYRGRFPERTYVLVQSAK